MASEQSSSTQSPSPYPVMLDPNSWNQLQLAICGQSETSIFSCRGEFAIGADRSSAINVHWSELKNGHPDGSLVLPTNQETDIARLNEACSPASFGRDQEDVYDEDYRKAGKMDASEFTTNFDPDSHCIMQQIQTILRPNNSIKAELYKLNVYSQGGKFKAHVDTPMHNRHWGTLVVVLPSFHAGGKFTIQHAGQNIDCDWGQISADTVHWVAFFSDCQHMVEEVTSGYRVTLTYNLLDNDAPTLNASLLSTVRSLPLYSQVETMLTHLRQSNSDLTLGIFCSHAYAHTTGKCYRAFPEGLKGSDLVLYMMFKDLGCDVVLRPVTSKVTRGKSYYPSEDMINTAYVHEEILNRNPEFLPAGLEEPHDEYSDAYQTDLESINIEKLGFSLVCQGFMPVRLTDYQMKSRDYEAFSQLLPADLIKVSWLNYRQRNPLLQSVYLTYGNEAGQGYVYTNLAILVRVMSERIGGGGATAVTDRVPCIGNELGDDVEIVSPYHKGRWYR